MTTDDALKELVTQLKDKHGGFRAAHKATGIPYQTLIYWHEKGAGLKTFLSQLETIRSDLNLPRTKFWTKLIGDK
jgi:hypothetical protein